VVDLLVKKINRMPPEDIRTIRVASLLGNTFSLRLLSQLLGLSLYETAQSLKSSLNEGFVLGDDLTVVSDDLEVEYLYTFHFLHDKVQQAAYSLIPPKDLIVLHKITADLLMSSGAAEEDGILFSIAGHLSRALPILDDSPHVIALFARAAERAKSSTAYERCINYTELGIQLLGSDGWEKSYQTTFTLHKLRFEGTFLSGCYESE
jgi:predicted ATPase